MKTKFRLLATSCVICLSSQVTQAQKPAQPTAVAPSNVDAPNNESGLEDIIVTARRSSENLQRVPIAVTAFNAVSLAQNNVSNIAQISRITPSMSVTQSPYGPLGAKVAIRGQQVQDQQLDLTPSVGVYIDDVYQGSTATIGALGVQDAASVEVLKGPQGTLYGRNTTGGALKITTLLPNYDKIEGGGLAGIGNQGTRKLYAGISLPVVRDVAALRISGNLLRSSGYAKNPIDGSRIGSFNSKSVRAAFRAKPSSNLEVIIRGDILDGNATLPSAVSTYVAPGGLLNLTATAQLGLPFTAEGIGAAFAYLQQFVNQPGHDNSSNALNQQTLKQQQVSGTIIWTPTENLQLKSITAYQHVNTVARCDEDKTPIQSTGGICSAQKFDQFTQEFQATGDIFDGSFSYTLGYFYYNLNGTDYAKVDVFTALAGVVLTNDSTVDDTSNAGYVQLRYNVTDAIRLNGGLRYTKESVDVDARNRQAVFGTPICNVPSANQLNGQCLGRFPSSFSNWSYQAGIDADLAANVLGYLTTTRGFKAGGVNLRGSSTGGYTNFAPEVATNYEIGLKTELFDRMVRLNAAAFYTDYKNIQRTVFVFDNAGNPSSEVRNAAAAKIKGVEMELTVRPTQGLTFTVNGSHVDPKYKRYIVPATGQDISDNRFAGISKWQASFVAAYSADTAIGRLTASGDVSYRSSVDFAPDTHSPASPIAPNGTAFSTQQKGYALVNARLALAVTPTLEIAAWGRNLGDKRYAIEGLDQSGSVGHAKLFLGAPRSYGLDVSLQF